MNEDDRYYDHKPPPDPEGEKSGLKAIGCLFLIIIIACIITILSYLGNNN